MIITDFLLLFITGLSAGVVNSVAGGGALIIFPLLISMGISPKLANSTISIGVYGGQISSAYGYKAFLSKIKDKRLFIFLFIGLLGGLTGALLLDRTSNSNFESIAPWFVLFAVFLLAIQPYLAKKIKDLAKKSNTPQITLFVLLCIIAGLISVYGGFFGGGMGIMIFAILGFTGIQNVNQINGMKNLITISINTSANVYFVASGLVKWDVGIVLFIGSTIGGYIGSRTASRLPAQLIRSFVIIAGIVAAIVLFNK
ncbi:MAG: sulfite exporter TauE/SafE family protein, partial [Candidatus Saccharibacteria bacterium]|nr:sulfite exporter TauE/SafE family protein [Candidatus Saccharibacteria bacterium]